MESLLKAKLNTYKTLLDRAHDASYIEVLDLNGLDEADSKTVRDMFIFKINHWNSNKPFTSDWKEAYIKDRRL